jgi:signal transduction histidine kinase
MIATALLFIAGCSDTRDDDDGVARYQLEPVAEPEALPYRFEVVMELSDSREDGVPFIRRVIPMRLDSTGQLGGVLMVDNWRPRDSLSCLTFHTSVTLARGLRQVNLKSMSIDSWLVTDLDRDRADEIAVGYVSDDTAWLEIHNTREALSKVALIAGQDRDGSGHWDGHAFILEAVDLTGDEQQEILVGIDCGYDEYPRRVMAVDWRKEEVLWQFPVSGAVRSYWTSHIMRDSRTDSLTLVFRVSSKGNGTITDIMSDDRSYLLALNADGDLRWYREVGGEFDPVWAEIVDYNDDGRDEVVCEGIEVRESRAGIQQEAGSYRSFFTVFDNYGHIIDSIDVGHDREIRQLLRTDVDGDGLAELVASSVDSSLMIFDHRLQLIAELEAYCNVRFLAAEDFLGRGDEQYLVLTLDRRTWLLDDHFEPLARFDEGSLLPRFTNWYPDPDGGGLNIMGGIDHGSRTFYLSLQPTPWFSVFFRKPWLASVAAAVPLAVIILIVTVALLRIRQKNRVILAAQEELKATQAKLIAAEKFAQARSIAGGFAHEIRNALFPARTWLGKLRRMAGDDPKQIKPVDRTEQAVLRAIETTHKISMYTKLEENPPPEPVEFQQVLQESLREHQDRINELQVQVDVTGDTRTTVMSRPDLLKVVLDNLIRNALDALTETEIKRIIAVTGCAQGDALTVRFEDNGIGISRDEIGKVFEAFYSTKPTTGTGLGLPMARKIMEMYDGSIEVTSQPDRGAIFVLTLKTAN